MIKRLFVANRGEIAVRINGDGVSALGIETWGLRKARRVGGRLDAAAGAVIDGGLDRLHEVVEARLGGHPVLAELVEEAEEAGGQRPDRAAGGASPGRSGR